MAIKSELQRYFSFDNTVPMSEGNIRKHITCNEAITPDFLTILQKQRAKKPGGVGLTIGSGGAVSLLPNLRLDGLIFVDVNPAVLGFTKFLVDCIATAQNPDHAREMIINDLPQGLHEVDEEDRKDGEKVPGIHQVVANKLTAEKRYFGTAHWSDPETFYRVQDALDTTTFAYANRSIASSSFHLELASILRQTGENLTYINFSNVHHWLTSTKPFKGLQPTTDPEATIQYSVHPVDEPNANLVALIAESFDRYLDLSTKEIKALGKKSATGRKLPKWSSQP